MANYNFNPLFLTKDGKPWFPVMGEMHYSRYPKDYWKESLYKIKAGGVDVVSCYVPWIHHEEIEAEFNFSGDRDLRFFLQTAKDCDIKVFLRIGPWAHGELRNGGFPDWLLEKNIPLRCDDERYLSYVARFFEQIFNQAKGYFDRDNGPVIGVQIENEYGHVGGLIGEEGEQHMRTLQNLAKKIGFDVDLYTATGWGGAVTGGMLPVMGGYCDAPWDQRLTEIEPSGNYIFTKERNDHNIGSDFGFGYGITYDMDKFPFLTAELGGGLQVTHHRRPVAKGQDVAAMSLVKMGSGCNLLGYYMYHGGTNPDGKLNTLQESRHTGYTNDLPVKSYDFNAPIREHGQLSESYREIRMLSMFLHDFGENLCHMQAFIPKDNPLTPKDQTRLRYSIRRDQNSAYLFINNYQRRHEMAKHKQVKMSVELENETVTLPALDIANGDFFFLPVNMPLGEFAVLKSTNTTPLCCLNQNTWVFYKKDPKDAIYQIEGDKSKINIITLSRAEALTASKITLDQDYLFLCDRDVIRMDDGIHFQGRTEKDEDILIFKTYPALPDNPDGFEVSYENDFAVYTRIIHREHIHVKSQLLLEEADITKAVEDSSTAGIEKTDDKNRNDEIHKKAYIPDAYPKDGKVYKISLSKPKNAYDVFLVLDFIGDRMEIYADGILLDDAFYTGQKIELGLKRFQFPTELIIKAFSLHKDAKVYLEQFPKITNESICEVREVQAVLQWDICVHL